MFPYDEEVVTTQKKRRKKSKQKVIQTQTSPARQQVVQQRSETPTGTLLSERSQRPAVLITEATPQPSPRDFSPEPSLPGAIDDEKAWASPYPEPVPSVSEPQSSRKRQVVVERVTVSEHRAVTPSGVDVTATSISRGKKSKPKKDLFEMLPDVDDSSKNSRPG